jgi:hypothetical protein
LADPRLALAGFPNLAKGCRVKVGSRVARFSTRADYLSWLVEQKLLTKATRFAEHGDLVARVYRNWQTQGQLACRFAQQLARQAEGYGMRACVINASSRGNLSEEAVSALSHACRTACESKEVQALALLFPRIESAAALVRLLKILAKLPGWAITAAPNPSDRLQRVHVRVHYRLDAGHVAEALGFGPFQFLPLTRRAPVVALEMLTKVSRPKESALGRPKRLHLAGIELDWPASRIKRVWQATEENRLYMLGGDDSAAKAKVSFAIPRRFWQPRVR